MKDCSFPYISVGGSTLAHSVISLECVVNSNNFLSTFHIVEHELNLGFLWCHHSSSSHRSWLCEIILRER